MKDKAARQSTDLQICTWRQMVVSVKKEPRRRNHKHTHTHTLHTHSTHTHYTLCTWPFQLFALYDYDESNRRCRGHGCFWSKPMNSTTPAWKYKAYGTILLDRMAMWVNDGPRPWSRARGRIRDSWKIGGGLRAGLANSQKNMNQTRLIQCDRSPLPVLSIVSKKCGPRL